MTAFDITYSDLLRALTQAARSTRRAVERPTSERQAAAPGPEDGRRDSRERTGTPQDREEQS